MLDEAFEGRKYSYVHMYNYALKPLGIVVASYPYQVDQTEAFLQNNFANSQGRTFHGKRLGNGLSFVPISKIII